MDVARQAQHNGERPSHGLYENHACYTREARVPATTSMVQEAQARAGAQAIVWCRKRLQPVTQMCSGLRCRDVTPWL